jgi:hypothetical protein
LRFFAPWRELIFLPLPKPLKDDNIPLMSVKAVCQVPAFLYCYTGDGYEKENLCLRFAFNAGIDSSRLPRAAVGEEYRVGRK